MKLISTLLIMATATLAIHQPVEAGSKKHKGKKSHKEVKKRPTPPPQLPVTPTPPSQRPNPVQQAPHGQMAEAPKASSEPFYTLPAQPNAIVEAVNQLNQYATLQQQLGIQNADLAYGMRKALVMADLLINADGTLNLNACSIVKAAFIPASPREYEVNMGRVIDQLSSTWQDFFSTVTAPADQSSAGALSLRALFSMGSQDALTDRHAKVAVLAAMLAPYNQGPVGDCFAVNDVIRDHEEYFLHAAEDYQSVVMNSYVARLVNGNTDYFFYLPVLADDDLAQTFTLNADGTFAGVTCSLLDAPGFAAAAALMGASGVTASSIMQALNANGNQVQVTPSQVIAAMASIVGGDASVGEYAFSSLTNNPQLRGVEAAFSAMAEDRPNDSMRSQVNGCVNQVLQKTWAKLAQKEGIAQFQQAFESQFNASYRLLYNLNVPLAQPASDGSSTDGGFQLYQRMPNQPSQMGIRMATPHDFKKLATDAVLATAAALGSTPAVMDIAKSLKNVVGTDEFLRNALWAYDPANRQVSDPIKDYQKLSSSPMQSCYGDNPFEVDDIDTGTNYDKSVQGHTIANAADLIAWCLNLAKVASADMIPMDSPQHAFNFMPKNPDIAAFVAKKITPAQWIQNILVVPGLFVSRGSISMDVQQAVANQMYQQLQNIVDANTYKSAISGVMQQSVCVRDFANRFVGAVNRMLGSNASQAAQVGLVVDALLLQNLPANSLAVLNGTAIRFAFTNWNQGTEDIYFCAYFNPRTERVGFGTIFENKTNLQPMDENAWVNNQQWSVDLKPAGPVNAG